MTSPQPGAWGIDTRYWRTDGNEYIAPESTVAAILDSMGAHDQYPEAPAPLIVRSGSIPASMSEWEVTLENGERLVGSGDLPADLPLGYHSVENGEHSQLLIVAPHQCAPVGDKRSWGWAVQLYATRSRQSWGIGDLGDLKTFGNVARRNGANTVLLNPLHASLPGVPQESSPYFPSSRTFRNPLYICVEDVPGAARIGEQLQVAINAGKALNQSRTIDRNAIWNLKMRVLEALWAMSEDFDGLTAFIESQGEPLLDYATFCCLFEEFGRNWQSWPVSYRHPKSPAVKAFANEHAHRVRFHAWLQFLIDRQLTDAAESIDVMHDLAIGVDPGGADAWLWQDALALDMHVGSPPDVFNTLGQDWSFAPFDPWRLRAMNYAPFISTTRANLAHGAASRIDHVMGLFRLYWIPSGDSAENGTYVRYPAEDLLAILALESHRAGAYVVGEDLGTVEPETRDALRSNGVLSYKLMWFEPGPTHEYPELSMAAVTTHDLPTVAGLWTGTDLDMQHDFGMAPNEEGTAEMRAKVVSWAGTHEAPIAYVTKSLHHVLGRAGSSVVTATLEDALGCEQRPNYPGTTTEYPNWSVALPVDIEDFEQQEGFQAVSAALRQERNSA